MKVGKSEVEFCRVVVICIAAAEIEIAEENKVTEFAGVRSVECIGFLSFGFFAGAGASRLWSMSVMS